MKKKAFWITLLISICIASAMPFSLLAEESGFDYENYYQLEYIDNSSYGYINTQKNFSNIGNLSIQVSSNNVNTWEALLGYNIDWDNNALHIFIDKNLNKIFLRNTYNGFSQELNTTITDRITYGISNNRLFVNNTYLSNIQSSNSNIYLFGQNSGSSANAQFTGYIYGFTWNNENYIPAQSISSNDVGFLNTTTGQFITSSGNSFIAGPIITPITAILGINVNVINRNSYQQVNSISVPVRNSTSTYGSIYITPNTTSSSTNPTMSVSSTPNYSQSASTRIGFTTTEGSHTESINSTEINHYIYEYEIIFDKQYIGYIFVDNVKYYFNGNSLKLTKTYGNGTPPELVLGESSFTESSIVRETNTSENVSIGESTNTRNEFDQAFGNLDSIESNQINETTSALSNVDTTFTLGSNSKFLKSAEFVKQQFDTNFSNNQFGSILIFSLTVGLVMLLIGKVLK